jgi:HSP20 family protein
MEATMAQTTSKVPVKTEPGAPPAKSSIPAPTPLTALRREIERLFDDFDGGFWRFPFHRSGFDLAPLWRNEIKLGAPPAVDIAESDRAYEISAELPGMDEKNIEVKLVNGSLSITGEKREEKEEKKKDYYLQERRFGSFERRFRLPEGVDTGGIEATFKKGVLKVTLPKTAAAQKPQKKIAVKAA